MDVTGAEDVVTRAIEIDTTGFSPARLECSWRLGLGVVTTRRATARVPGCFGWDGAFGTSWWVDPREQLIGVFLTQRRPDVLAIPPSILDFWTSAYQLIDD